ncbi:MAG: FAD-dependent oxidoreductase, partial [Candidatus Cloacimonetes bacterium]|nr:FAD-dependent oxidoreductase [Candidatus Cloacimonadota bacterium]
KEEDLETLEELAYVIKDTSLCGLGQTAPNSVLSTLRYFRQEYLDHINKKRCEAAVCKNIISSPCQHTCPIDTEAPLYIALIARKRYEESLDVIKKENPFASVVARVCHHPCESKCRAGDAGEPVAIRGLKRFVTDYGLKHGLCLKTDSAVDKNKEKVAIIGSGPAGLTCAFYLAKKGYQATVFEKLSVAGGMLTTAIPKFRLPREILNADLEFIKSSGFEIQTEKELGRDFTIQELYDQNFKAIFIATGGHQSWKLGIPGEDSKGVLYGLEVLKDINMDREVNIGKRVGIVGGGNSAVDAARALLRKGLSETITIYYRRTINEMPAYQEEIDAALEEGIEIKFLTSPTKIISENGILKGCEFVKMELGDVDTSGRRKPIPIKGSEFVAELDNLVVAISEYPDTSFLDKGTELQVTEGGNIVVDPETLQTTQDGIFAGGDIVMASDTVIQAIAAGKIASESIEQFLKGEDVKRVYKLNRPSKYIEPLELSEEELQEIRSQTMPHLSIDERKSNFGEVELGFDEEQAVKEGKLCLRCDLETKEGQQFLEELKKAKE